MDYSKYINAQLQSIPPSGIRKFFDVVNEMPDAISLGVGEPDFVTPWDIRDAGIKSLQRGYTQYTSNRGLPQLLDNIAAYLSGRFGLQYDAGAEILVTVGASEAIDLAFRAFLNEGDEVLLPTPSFVAYSPLVKMTGGAAIEIPGRKEDGFRLTPADLEAAVTPRSKILLLPFPNNPTGAIMEKRDLEGLLPIIEKHGLLVISDEIYAELTYGGRHVSIASLPGMRGRTVVLNGFSKAFAMTGWRIGYAAGPRGLIAPMLKLHQYAIMCAPSAAQYAAAAALSGGRQDGYAVVAEMRNEYDKRRRFLVKSFNDMGLTCFEPKGAFYAFPDVSSAGMDGTAFAEKLLYA
ncbi:MAG: aminotransferase class I/II-fold pyridoxal phosphate-dependent enzyme, partial [Clostridiales bacterium]|nr:aminotransferase class I/II-fold pyridoxal phosphate-dependent enzyme [Clostridiales bacterium]